MAKTKEIPRPLFHKRVHMFKMVTSMKKIWIPLYLEHQIVTQKLNLLTIDANYFSDIQMY